MVEALMVDVSMICSLECNNYDCSNRLRRYEGTFVFEGAMDVEMFVAYVKHVLVPELGSGNIVVMDNLKS